MKSRLAILGMLVAGMLFSTTGAGLAITGFANNDSASVAQYGGDKGEQGGGGDNGDTLGGGDQGGTNNGGGADDGTQGTRQVEVGAGTGSGELPFTGFAAIPVLIGGVALLSGGLVLRRRSRDEPQA